MGGNMVRRLLRDGHECVAFDQNLHMVQTLAAEGAIAANTLQELVAQLQAPRVIWLMLPAAIVDRALEQLTGLLAPGDILIDGGNTHYVDDIRRAKALAEKGLHYVDVGTSGGVWGLERGYCLMIGGEAETVAHLEPIFQSLAPGKGMIAKTPARPVENSAELGYTLSDK
jgi:6-phosphogluconate dehydrogenase